MNTSNDLGKKRYMKYVASNTIYLALKLILLIKIIYFSIFYLSKLMKILFLLQFDATFIIICKFLSNKRHFCSKRVFEG